MLRHSTPNHGTLWPPNDDDDDDDMAEDNTRQANLETTC